MVGKSLKKLISDFTVDDLVNGKTFSSGKTSSRMDQTMHCAKALEEALNYAGPEGIVTNLPEFIAAKIKAYYDHDIWRSWYNVHSEEFFGIDKKGKFCKENEHVLIVLHGGGVLSPDRIREAFGQGVREGFIERSVKLREEEFDALLEGKLPDGTSFPLYRPKVIREKSFHSLLPHRFGVVMPYETALAATEYALEHRESASFPMRMFQNPLVVARTAVSLNELIEYYVKTINNPIIDNLGFQGKERPQTILGNFYPFENRRAISREPEGRIIQVNPSDDIGYYPFPSNNSISYLGVKHN